MRNKIISFCLIAWLLSALPLTAMAKQLDYGRKGSISVTLASKNSEQPMAGAELAVYYVATVAANTDGDLHYSYTDEFDQCGFSMDDPALVSKLNTFVSRNPVTSQKIVTDSQGKAVCTDLPLGLYFVKQTGEVDGFADCTPFLVTVPMETDTEYVYHVNASPKTDVVRLTDITVKKVWNTGSSSSASGSVTVQLLNNGKVVKTAVLSKYNNWQITYADMPESDGYTIKEINVPRGYTATYGKKDYVFTVTNTPTLAQTGQLIWPIPVFAVAGMALLLIGFVILRKPGKQDA